MADKQPARQLTEAEQRRTENYERITAQMEDEGWRRTALTVDMRQANVFALTVGGALCVPFLVAFFAVNGLYFGPSILEAILFLALYLMLIPVHEGIHGLVWGALAPGHFRSIDFGFMKETLTPYCTCTQPMARGRYFAGCLAPLVVLGLIPSVAGIVLDCGMALGLGLLMIVGAGGDMLISWELLKYGRHGRDQVCLDHPSECGLAVFER